ncbi:MAG: prepilin-type N-terminal cleavage/methylation domain-containing protein [Pseudomonadota bacterium]
MRRPGIRNAKGFTLIELMIVIAIIGILAAIAIPNFFQYRQRSHDAQAMTELGNVYRMAMQYYVDEPDGTVTDALLRAYGWRQTVGVSVFVVDGGADTLILTAEHAQGTHTYSINQKGEISY